MSTPAQRGHLAWALQYNKLGNAAVTGTTLNPGNGYIVSAGWQRHKTITGDVQPVERIGNLQPALGGGLYLDGTYKGGVHVQGGMSMEPRLQNSLGYLLYAALGATTSTASGTNRSVITRFYVNDANQSSLPWMAVRKYMPDTVGTGGTTEYFTDCKLDTMRITMPPEGVMGLECSFMGRRPLGSIATEDTTGSALEDPVGVPLSFAANVTLNFDVIALLSASSLGTSSASPNDIYVNGIEIVQANGLSGVREESIVGSKYLDDVIPLSRATQFRIGLQWTDPGLYDRMMYGVSSGTFNDWNGAIQTGSVSVELDTAANIGSPYTHPYKLVLGTNSLSWSMAAPRMLPGRIMTSELVATVKQTLNSTSPFWIDLWNLQNYNFTS